MNKVRLSNEFMTVNGLNCQVNLPDAPEGDGTYGLPPHKKQGVYKVDEFPACPDSWMHGNAKASSYFFPVGKGKHMWLDFNLNWRHKHHVAIVLSIQGINPITGQQSKVLRLEQYREKCPVHENEEFKQDRFCEKCDFKWPSQNYMTTTSTPNNRLWVDGWRAEADTIRGFLITAETMKGIAAQVIGEQRVWAIGIAFYLSKEAKPVVTRPMVTINGATMQNDSLMHKKYMAQNNATKSGNSGQGGYATYSSDVFVSNSGGIMRSMGMSASPEEATPTKASSLEDVQISAQSVNQIETEKLEIAAGAKITQELAHHDPNDLSFYEDEPAGVIYGNYCSTDDFEKIIEAGVRDMTKGGEGALAGLNTGNSNG